MGSSFYSDSGLTSTEQDSIESAIAAAETAQSAAETAKADAETAKTNAETAEVNAETAQTAAEAAQTAAETAQVNAGNSASASATSATQSASSATSSASSASTASTKASEASVSATNALASANNSSSSASSSATSAAESATSATASASSATSAAASLSTFQNQYLGASASAPTQDPDGSALDLGDLYFDTTANVMKVYSSSGWTNASSSVNGTSERQTYTATAGQTTFSVTYDAGYVDVWLNGAKLLAGTDFTATSGTNIVLASGAAAGDIIDIIAFGTFVFTSNDHYTKTASDARYVASSSLNGDIDTHLNQSSATSGQYLGWNGSDYAWSSVAAGYTDSDVDAHLLTAGITLDATNDRLGVNNASPATALDVTGTVTADDIVLSDADAPSITLTDTTNTLTTLIQSGNSTAIIGTTTNHDLRIQRNGTDIVDVLSTGVDVTGTVTADGLTVDGATSMSDADTTAIASISDLTPSGSEFQFKNTDNSASYSALRLTTRTSAASSWVMSNEWSASYKGDLVFRSRDSSSTINQKLRLSNNGDISFYEDSGSTASFVWDSSQTQIKITGRETSRSNDTYAFEVDNSTQSSNMTAAGAMRVKGYYGDSLVVNGLGDVSFFDDSGTAKLFWDASAEALGIGGSPSSQLSLIEETSNTTTRSDQIRIQANSSGTTGVGFGSNIYFVGERNGGAIQAMGRIGFGASTNTSSNLSSDFIVETASAGTPSEAMRIDSSGVASIGSPSKTFASIDATRLAVVGGSNSSSNAVQMIVDEDGTVEGGSTLLAIGFSADNSFSTANYINFFDSGGQQGRIEGAGAGSVAYQTSSDRRLKSNIRDTGSKWDALKQIQVRDYEWTADTSNKTVTGFIAQELHTIFPDAVSEGDEDVTKKSWAVDYGRTTPIIIKALQEAIAKIETLETKVAALEAN